MKIREIKDKILTFFGKNQKSEESNPFTNIEEYRDKLARHKYGRLIGIAALVIVIVGGAVITKSVIDNRTYDSYKVLDETLEEDTAASKYIEVDRKSVV